MSLTKKEELELEQTRILQEKQLQNSLLLEAIINNNIVNVKRLLEKGASPNATCQESHLSACHIAAFENWEALRALLAAGADRYRTDKKGWTPLHYAAYSGGSRRIAMLLDFPEELQFKAALTVTSETMEEIKQFRSYISTANKHLMSAIVALKEENIPEEYYDLKKKEVEKKEKEETEIQFLVKENILSVYSYGKAKRTALHISSLNNKVACVRVLLAAGADPNAKDNDEWTALDLAYRKSAYERSCSTIHYEEKEEFILMIKSLLEFGSMPHPEKWESVLRTAVLRNCPEILPDLLEAGAPVLFNNKYWHIGLCKEKKYDDCLKIIVEYVNRVYGTGFSLQNAEELIAQTRTEHDYYEAFKTTYSDYTI